MAEVYWGIEIGGTKLQIVVGDASLRISHRSRFTVEPSKGAAAIRQQIQGALESLSKTAKPTVIGVGFGGPVEWKTGKICCSHHVEGWSGFDLGVWLRSLTGVPVAVDNDANVAALGEALRGAG